MSGEQLTPREAALWNRTRQETLRDLEVDFRRYMKTAEGHEAEDLEAATWAHDIVAGALVRLGRVAGTADELPPAPCSIPGVFLPDRPWLLCGYPAGHSGQHAWAQLPPEGRAPWWRRR
jgi:hypothetical protein